MLQQLKQRLQRHTPRQLCQGRPQAGVLLPVTDDPVNPELIFTLRSANLSTHGGEVAFPGGKRDPDDDSVLVTALRETHEEIGVPPDQVHVIGQLGQVLSKHGLQVTPFVGLVDPRVPLIPNPDELDTVFRVPIRYLLEDPRTHTDRLPAVEGKSLYVPSYLYEDYCIWGLTAYLMVELLNIGFDAGIPMRPRPEMEIRDITQ